MTVAETNAESGEVKCRWFLKENLKSAVFYRSELIDASDAEVAFYQAVFPRDEHGNVISEPAHPLFPDDPDLIH